MIHKLYRWFWGPIVVAAIACAAFGQSGATGTILGTVTDSAGAVVPNATVTITNTGTGVSHRATTSSSGDYSVPDLNPGPYSVTIESPGFSKETVGGVSLGVAQQARVNGSPEAGSRDGDGAGQCIRGRARYGHRRGDATGDAETGRPASAERAQFSESAVHRRGRGADRGRAGTDAPGAGQRDQHQRRAAGVEQLHAGRHGEYGYGAQYAGRDPVAGCHPGIPGAERDLLGGVRLQRQPDQHREQERHEQAARLGLRICAQRCLRCQHALSAGEAGAAAEPVRVCAWAARSSFRSSTTAGTRPSGWRTTKDGAFAPAPARTPTFPARRSWAAIFRRAGCPRMELRAAQRRLPATTLLCRSIR